ncbi:MAG: serine acetyltransferase [Candidatus Paceibacterota bacterium]
MDAISSYSNGIWEEGVALIRLVLSDLERYKDSYKARGSKFSKKAYLESFVFKPGFQAVLLYRVSHFLYKVGMNYAAWAVSRINQILTSAEIEFNAEFGPGLFIAHPSGIVVGRGSKVGKNCTMFQQVTLGVRSWEDMRYPAIGDGAVLFSGSKVLGGIRIGNNVTVGANAVVFDCAGNDMLCVGNQTTKHKRMKT